MIDPGISNIIRARRSTYPKDFNGEIIEDHVVKKILENAKY